MPSISIENLNHVLVEIMQLQDVTEVKEAEGTKTENNEEKTKDLTEENGKETAN